LQGTSRKIHESIANSWRITPDVVVQFRDIANFKASRHNMWIEARRDLGKEWLQLRYCVMEEDIEMDMRDWKYDWRVPVLTQEVPKGTEADPGSTKIPTGAKVAPKKLKPSQKLVQQKKGSVPKKDALTGKKDIVPIAREQERGEKTTQETPSTTSP
jgi:hypothetical protein